MMIWLLSQRLTMSPGRGKYVLRTYIWSDTSFVPSKVEHYTRLHRAYFGIGHLSFP